MNIFESTHSRASGIINWPDRNRYILFFITIGINPDLEKFVRGKQIRSLTILLRKRNLNKFQFNKFNKKKIQ